MTERQRCPPARLGLRQPALLLLLCAHLASAGPPSPPPPACGKVAAGKLAADKCGNSACGVVSTLQEDMPASPSPARTCEALCGVQRTRGVCRLHAASTTAAGGRCTFRAGGALSASLDSGASGYAAPCSGPAVGTPHPAIPALREPV